MASGPEQRVKSVPPFDVVTVLTGTFGGGADTVVSVADDGVVDHVGAGVIGGAKLELVGRVMGVVAVVGEVVLDDDLVGEVVDAADGRVAGEVSSSSIAVCESRVPSCGATPLATRPTAANASVTATTTPSAQTPASSSPRLTLRFSSSITPAMLNRTARPAQAPDRETGRWWVRPTLGAHG
jgi:hypothetical protein